MAEIYPCPECGETAMTHVVENCHMEDGFAVRNLRHLKCGSCGARFFDDAAMHVIQDARGMQMNGAKQLHKAYS